jgi:hypothetical protein
VPQLAVLDTGGLEMKRRILAIVTLGVMALAVPAAVLADTFYEPGPAFSNEMTIQVSGATLQAKGILVNITGTITCDPLVGVSEGDGPVVSGWVKQAVTRKSIAFGSRAAYGASVVCDGGPHPFTVQVSADQTGVPFTRGAAVVAASGQICVRDPDTYALTCRSAATGWLVVKLTR